MAITLTSASAKELQIAAAACSATHCCAVLPYWPIWAAAQFASTDNHKKMLGFVRVWRDGDVLQIESTDGQGAFRYRLPAWSGETDAGRLPTLWRVPDSGLLLHAKPLKKAVAYSKLLTVSHDMRATFHGGKRSLTELSSVNLAGFFGVNTVEDCCKVGSYPNLNQLWPSAFNNQPGAPWAFNARYLREWCAVVEKLSPDAVTRTQGNSSATPFVFSCAYKAQIGEHFGDARLELLLMPVRIREWGK